jgi:magnesium-transporting ATPase (P-type)
MTTTADATVHTPHSRTLRRATAAAGLIGFSALLVVQAVVDPAQGGTGEVMFRAAAETPGALFASSLLLMVSALLTIPAVSGLLHQARDRGAALANWAAFFAVLGAFGHVAIGVFYLLSLGLPGGDRAAMEGFVDRTNALPELSAVAFPLILCFGIGLALMAWTAWRVGLVGWWGPAAVTAIVLLHDLLPFEVPAAASAATLAVPAAVFGWIGVRSWVR